MHSSISTKRVVLISLIVDLLDIVTNLLAAVFTGSAVIFAEAVQGVIDSIGSIFLIVGYKRSRLPKDAGHPFGYTKEVFFWALLSSMIMLFLGSGLSIWKGIDQMIHPELLHNKWLALGILCFSVLTNGFALNQSIRRLSIKGVSFWNAFAESSSQLVRTAFLRDLLGTTSACVGLVSIFLYDVAGIVIFDGIGAIIIGLLMALLAVVLITQAQNFIIGQSVSRHVMKKIRRSVEKIPHIVTINRLVGVYIGSDQILVDLDVDLNKELTTVEIERVLDSIKETIIADVPETLSVQIDLNSPKVKEEVKIERTKN